MKVTRPVWAALTLVLLVAMLWGAYALQEEEPLVPDGRPVLSGTFLQIDHSIAAWSEAQWAQEFDWMKAVGLELIIVQYAAYGDAWWYPSAVRSAAPDHLGRLLRLAEERDMGVFLGLTLDPEYWTGTYDVEGDLARNMMVADELHARYGDHPAFTGWYIPHELSDYVFRDRRLFETAVATGSALLQHLKELTPDKPVSIAPYYGTYQSERDYRRSWEEFLEHVPVDIIMLQDGVGTHRVGVKDIKSHYRAVKQAIGNRPIQLWSDVEIFDQIHGWPVDDAPWAATSADLPRIIEQMEAAHPYVERFVAFEFSHYMSPRLGTGAALYDQYQAYLREIAAAEEGEGGDL